MQFTNNDMMYQYESDVCLRGMRWWYGGGAWGSWYAGCEGSSCGGCVVGDTEWGVETVWSVDLGWTVVCRWERR